MSGRERAVFIQAGHAVGARLGGMRVVKVSIIPCEDADSWIDVDEPVLPNSGPLIKEWDCIAARALIVALLAGPAAGQRYSFGSCDTEFNSCRDLLSDECVWRAAGLARRLGSGTSGLHLLWRAAALIVNANQIWSAIGKLVTHLLEYGKLNGEEAERILANCYIAPGRRRGRANIIRRHNPIKRTSS